MQRDLKAHLGSRRLNKAIEEILRPAYCPCPALTGVCGKMRWDPDEGHVPRGFRGGAGRLDEIELVLVFAEPGDPFPEERQSGDLLLSAYEFSTRTVETGRKLFHRNVKGILDSCWPRLSYGDQLKKVWMTESVLCSARVTTGNVSKEVCRECGNRYLLPQLKLLHQALVVALGYKAQERLRGISYTDFLGVSAVAPPEGNKPNARESWKQIPIELRRHIKTR